MKVAFPQTSVTLIARIRDLGPGRDSAEWVRFWDSYSLVIRQFAARRCGEEKAEDILMSILSKLVKVLRSGQYTPEKGRFRSYLSTMIVNEVRMAHRRGLARAEDRKVSLDACMGDGEKSGAFVDMLQAPETSPEALDEEWRNAILKSSTEHVLRRTALTDRDRAVYRAYAMEGRPLKEVAAEFRISDNLVSKIKSRIDQRIVSVGRELVAGLERRV